MKTISKQLLNYLNGKSSLYKSMTRMEVMATFFFCLVIFLIIGTVESHTEIAISLTALLCIVWLRNTNTSKEEKQ